MHSEDDQKTAPEATHQPRVSALVRLAVVMAVAYAVCLGSFSVLAHMGLQTQMNDLGNADQAIWAASEGDWAMTVSNDLDGRLRSRIGIHANFIYWPLSLVYRLWPDPILLLLVATVSCTAAGLGLFALALRVLGPSWWTLVPPAAFYLSPMVQDANLYDFHALTIASACLVWAVWAFASHRDAVGFLLLFGALSCKEDVPLVGIALGVVYLLGGHRRRGLMVIALSTVYLLVVVGLLVPLFNAGEPPSKMETSANRYAWLTEQPGLILSTVLRPDRLRLPLYFLASGALAAWSARRWLLLLVPPLAAGWLSVTVWMTRLTGTYYWVVVEAAIVIACIYSVRPRSDDTPTKDRRPLAYLGAATVVLTLLFSPLPYGMGAWRSNYLTSPDIVVLEGIARSIPNDAPISIQNNLGPHLSQRPDIASFPRRIDHAEWVLLQLRFHGGPSSGFFVRGTPRFVFGMEPETLARSVEELLISPEWGLVLHHEGFYLFGRGEPEGLDPEAVATLFRDDVVAFADQLERSRAHRSPLTRLVVDTLSWGELFGRDRGETSKR